MTSGGYRKYNLAMENEVEQLKKRILELARRAEARGVPVETEFLTPAEQLELTRLRPGPFAFDGGFEAAERRCAVLLPWDGCEWESRVVCLEIAPTGEKFAGELSHRDYLGSLMALGLRRETMGDIVVQGKRAYLFCLESVAGYISQQLEQVRRTHVRVGVCDPGCVQPPEAPRESSVTVSSARLDALVAAVYRLSRGEAQRLFERELVLVNSLPPRSPGLAAKEGDVISVRGHGRFVFLAAAGETRKGRTRALVRVY